jgi:hypothetical protein
LVLSAVNSCFDRERVLYLLIERLIDISFKVHAVLKRENRGARKSLICIYRNVTLLL